MKVFLASLLTLLTLAPPQRSIDDFFNDFTARWIRENANQAISTRYFSGEEQDRLEQQFTPETLEFRKARIQLAREGLAELQKFDRAKMTPIQRVSAELMQSQLDTVVQGEPYLDYSFPLEQFGGANVTLPNALIVNHPMRTQKDAEHYIARLKLLSTRMDEATAEARRLSEKGMISPRFIIQATITQMQQFLGSLPRGNPLVSTFAEKMAGIPEIPPAKRQQLLAEADSIVIGDVYPAWLHAIVVLQTALPRANDDAGLWRLKGGDQAYAYYLKRFTTTNLTAEQIHQIGLQQVAKIEKEMDTILQKLGRTEGSVKDRIEKLKEESNYPNNEDGRKRIMADVEQILRDAEQRSRILFDKTPKAPVVAQPYPQFREANAAASYSAPSPDGSRPGTFQIPLRKERMTKFGLRSLVYHETVPGHHFQIALQIENPSIPRFRQIGAFGGISALSEGWGLYAEHLAAESGWYDSDLEGRLGQLDSELFRARRLVVDTGIHAKHWTRQQAIDYGIEASEVERYVVNPGQACSYMLGELKIIELREQAKKKQGNKFSMKAFHDAVLDTGTVPLDLLARQVQASLRF
jgi:uncharacterized protein (DUF885 family)